jgi:hypothetical protein
MHLHWLVSLLCLATTTVAQAPLLKELKAKEAAAKKDPEALFEVGKWAGEKALSAEAKRLYQAVLKLKPDHAGANEALGNALVEGKWISAKEAEALRKKALAAEFAAKGMVEVSGVWVDKDKADDAKRGVFHHEGEVVNLTEKLALQAGKVRHPDTGELIDGKHLEKAKNKFYPVGERWVDLKEADTYHSDIKRPWVVRTTHGTIVSTLSLAKIDDFKQYVDRGIERVREVLGPNAPLPDHRPTVVIAATVKEYGEYGNALGDETSSASAFLMSKDPRLAANATLFGKSCPAICDGTGDLGKYNAREAGGLAYIQGKVDDAGIEAPPWFLRAFGTIASRLENAGDASFYAQRHLQRGGVGNVKAFFPSFAINGEMEAEAIVHNLFNAGLMIDFAVAKEGGDPAVAAAFQEVLEQLAQPKKGGEKAFAKLQTALIAAGPKVEAHLQKLAKKP